jgi:hypothetical protein
MMLKIETEARAVSFLGVHKSDFLCSVNKTTGKKCGPLQAYFHYGMEATAGGLIDEQ